MPSVRKAPAFLEAKALKSRAFYSSGRKAQHSPRGKGVLATPEVINSLLKTPAPFSSSTSGPSGVVAGRISSPLGEEGSFLKGSPKNNPVEGWASEHCRFSYLARLPCRSAQPASQRTSSYSHVAEAWPTDSLQKHFVMCKGA